VRHRCYQTSTQVCRDKPTRLRFQRAMRGLLWRGDVDGAIAAAEGFRAAAKPPPDPRRPAPLDEWISYLDARRATIPCYRDRHRRRQYIGSGQAEKGNDLLVARCQKNQGMQRGGSLVASGGSMGGTMTVGGRTTDTRWRPRPPLTVSRLPSSASPC